jgi:hypothetical protein
MGELPQDSLLDTVLLALWEDCAEQGLFRYDVTACCTKVLPGIYGFVAQLNEGRATQKRPTEFRVDQVRCGTLHEITVNPCCCGSGLCFCSWYGIRTDDDGRVHVSDQQPSSAQKYKLPVCLPPPLPLKAVCCNVPALSSPSLRTCVQHRRVAFGFTDDLLCNSQPWELTLAHLFSSASDNCPTINVHHACYAASHAQPMTTGHNALVLNLHSCSSVLAHVFPPLVHPRSASRLTSPSSTSPRPSCGRCCCSLSPQATPRRSAAPVPPSDRAAALSW